jgi:hypothetical protein
MSSEDGWFAGAMADRDLAELSFAAFLRSAFRADSPRQYNLAQAPIYSQDPGLAAPLAALLPDIRIPAALLPSDSDVLQSVNFWMAARFIPQMPPREWDRGRRNGRREENQGGGEPLILGFQGCEMPRQLIYDVAIRGAVSVR